MQNYTCRHCGCTAVYTQQKGPHRGVYCSNCHAWICWVSKDVKVVSTPAPVSPEAQSLQRDLGASPYTPQAIRPVQPVIQTQQQPLQQVYYAQSTNCPPPSDLPWETEPPEAYIPPAMPFEAKVTPAPVTLLVHGFTEIMLSNGTRKAFPQDSRVVIQNGAVSVYNIATEELLQQYNI